MQSSVLKAIENERPRIGERSEHAKISRQPYGSPENPIACNPITPKGNENEEAQGAT